MPRQIARLGMWTRDRRWIWSGVAVAILWLILSLVTNRFSLSSLSGILLSASFLTLAGIGQMFVVATGRGNIDLSIASVITLSAFVALLTIRGHDANLAVGLLVTVVVGLLVGAVNAVLVVFLGIPAIIGTLATGYVLATATLLSNRAIPGFAVSPAIKYAATGRLAGMPIMLFLALAAVALAATTLRFTAFGQMLSATGQNHVAARLAGVKVNRVTFAAFLISSVIASLDGLLLGAYIGGAFLEMGQPYLLQSIAAVVLGGTLIFGGYATALGTMLASVLLILIVTTMQIMGLPSGAQDIVQGVVVILVLGLAGLELGRRKGAAGDASAAEPSANPAASVAKASGVVSNAG